MKKLHRFDEIRENFAQFDHFIAGFFPYEKVNLNGVQTIIIPHLAKNFKMADHETIQIISLFHIYTYVNVFVQLKRARSHLRFTYCQFTIYAHMYPFIFNTPVFSSGF